MNNDPIPVYPSSSGEETLEDVQREFPGWRIWQGQYDGRYYGSRSEGAALSTPACEDPTHLRDEILAALSRLAEGRLEPWMRP